MNNNEVVRNVKVIHQILSLLDIDFENECLYGYTELTIVLEKQPQESSVNKINLNCKQCKLMCVVFNGVHEVHDFEYCDPYLMKPCGDETKRDLQSLLYQDEYNRLLVDSDEGNGELSIK
jgi:hypothetical protein